MKNKSVYLFMGSAILLASCSAGAPSNNDIKKAFQNDIDQAASFLGGDAFGLGDNLDISIKNTKCTKQDSERYQCSFSMTMENPITGKQTYEQAGVFIKRDGRWHAVLGF